MGTAKGPRYGRLPKAGQAFKLRECLGCGSEFPSKGPGYRFCKGCTRINERTDRRHAVRARARIIYDFGGEEWDTHPRT